MPLFGYLAVEWLIISIIYIFGSLTAIHVYEVHFLDNYKLLRGAIFGVIGYIFLRLQGTTTDVYGIPDSAPCMRGHPVLSLYVAGAGFMIWASINKWIALGLLSAPLLWGAVKLISLHPDEDERSKREADLPFEQVEEAIRAGEKQFCKECGGELKLKTKQAENGEVEEIRCEKGCTRLYSPIDSP